MKATRIFAVSGAALVALPLASHAQTPVELAGNTLSQNPFFEYVRAFNEGSPISLAVNTGALPALVGNACDLYVCASKTAGAWASSPGLADISGGAESFSFTAGAIQANTVILDTGSISGDAGTGLGVPFDVVIDVNQDGMLDAGDYIDGYLDVEAGGFVVSDTTAPGPLAVTELTYDLSGAAWDEQNTFYPSAVAGMGELPLVVISHGNGHNYQWYDHMGTHLASYGYVVMSHSNNTGPGVASAATTTLSNTDAFLSNLATIGGGALLGHIDDERITWIGHSRGGEGICIAYDRMFDGVFPPGTHIPLNYTLSDIKLISSIAPSDFEGFDITHPHAANYHLWTGAADSDVNGCANCDICQTFQLHDRAEQYRQSTSLYGVGHAWFHNGGGNPWAASAPCLVGQADTHLIIKGYLLPLVKRYIDGNVPAKDFLARQYESFHPIGAPIGNPCVVVNLMYRDGAAPGNVVLDDYQTNFATGLSSSGITVISTVTGVTEDNMDDPGGDFNNSAEAFNGFTVDGDGDSSRGVVFEWSGGSSYYAFIVPSGGPVGLWDTLSFRACQSTRDNLTTPVLADLTFDVTMVDTSGTFSRINISAFGGGVEEPYQRKWIGVTLGAHCGSGGAGWANEFETIRIPVEAFAYNGSGLDLNDVFAIGFEFGPGHGSNEGRIGVDDVELLLK